MLFIFNDRKYKGHTAVEIVRDLEAATFEYKEPGGSIRHFLIWSLKQMEDRIPLREMDVSPNLDDETISFNYLCLLDSCRIGAFYEQLNSYTESEVEEALMVKRD